MQINARARALSLVANGTQNLFLFDFRVFAAADLVVKVNGVLASYASPAVSALQYNVTLNGGSEGGSITFGTVPAAGTTIAITVSTPITYSTDFPTSGPLSINALNGAFERLTVVAQESAATAKRGLAVPEGETIGALPALATRVSKLLGFDTAGAVAMYSQADFKGLKGDAGAAGGNVMAIGLFSAMSSISVPLGTDRVRTSGRALSGIYGWDYILDADQTANTVRGQALIDAVQAAEGAGQAALALTAVQSILNRIRVQSANGRWFVIDDNMFGVHAGHFGAVPGIGITYATGVVTGTNAQPAIQAMIDWRVYLNIQNDVNARACLLPAGDFVLDDGLQLSYGDNFATVSLIGAGRGRQGYGGGTSLYARFNNKPVISIQRGRAGGVYRMNIVSAEGDAYCANNQFGTIEHYALINFGKDERDLTAWHDHAKPTRSALLRYNPFCAIAVDPYAGPQVAAPTPWGVSSVLAKGVYRTAGGNIYISTRAGTTAATGVGPAGETGRIDDGTVRWAYIGAVGSAVNYPSAAAAAFLPAASRVGFNRGVGSSNMNIEEVQISGFPVGIANQPCDNDGNADFLACRNVDIVNTTVPVSIGNTQARNSDFYRVNVNTYHTMITNSMHGRQNGRADGQWLECSSSSGIQLFQLNAGGVTGNVLFQKFYAEVLWRIGEVVGTGGLAFSSVDFKGGLIDCVCHATTAGARGRPNFMVGREDSIDVPNFRVTMNGTTLAAWDGVAAFNVFFTRFIDFNLVSSDASGGVTTQWRARALNTLAGGIVIPRLDVKGDNLIQYQAQNETALGGSNTRTTHRANRLSSRDYPTSMFTPSLCPFLGDGAEEIINPNRVSGQDWGNFTGVALTGLDLVFTHPYTAVGNLAGANLVLGTVIFDSQSNMVFIIKSRVIGGTSTSFVAELQNGYSRSLANVIVYEKPFVATNSVYFCSGGIFTPSYPLFADSNSASATITNCQRGDGYGGFIANNAGCPIQVDDFIFSNGLNEDGFFSTTLKVNSLGAAAITFNGAPYQTVLKRRYPLWMRGS